MNNTPQNTREGLDLKNAMPPVPHEVLRAPSNIEQNQIPTEPVQLTPQPEVPQQSSVPNNTVEENNNHDTSPSVSGLVFAQSPQDPKEVVERGTDSRLNNISEAESLANMINQIQSE